MWLEFVIFGTVSYLLYQYLQNSSGNVWKKHGVRLTIDRKWTELISIFTQAKTFGDLDQVMYRKMGSEKVCGTVEFRQPNILIKDMDLVKKVMIKDFDHFVDRKPFVSGDERQSVVAKLLFNTSGEEWKGIRSSISPTFTTGKIRRMMEYFNIVAHDWETHFQQLISQSPNGQAEFLVRDEADHYTVDVITKAVFGMDTSMIKNPGSEFALKVKAISSTDLVQNIKFGIAQLCPQVMTWLNIDLFPNEVLSFFYNIFSTGLKARMEGKEKRNDFMQLLVEARKGVLKAEGSDELGSFEKDAELKSGSSNVKKDWLQDDLTVNAQLLQFFFAGFGTTSNLLQFSMYHLAVYPSIQQKLREEVNSKLFSGGSKDIDYDQLNELVYMDMFVSEVLRKFPALTRIDRKCVKEYHNDEEGFTVPKGAYAIIPVQAIHHDTKYYERPHDFYPEHFSPENKAKRDPYAFLAFGTGPRNCVGMRFALVEGKAALAHLVHSFKIEPTPETPIPVKVQGNGLGTELVAGLKLKISKI